MIIFIFIYIHFIYAFHNILPCKPRLFYSSRNNTGIDTRFPQENQNSQLLINIRENILRKNLIQLLENENISEQYKLDRIKHFDFLFNNTLYVNNLHAGGLFMDYEDFIFD